jgi:heme-degrading monooxygenase HmoA
VTTLLIKMRVADFDQWKPAFDQMGEVRKEHGCRKHWVYRGAEDPNQVVAHTEWPSHEAARAFLSDERLTEGMQRGGVSGQPDLMWVGDEVDSAEY